MRAVIYDAYEAAPRVASVPDPVCAPDGVIVRVRATGVCRSDWHAWMGHDPVPLPMVPGHEFAGDIAAVGAQVTRWRVGDRVTVPFACGCGRCGYCDHGDTHICPAQTQPGFTKWGSYADLVAVDVADLNVVALPAAIGYVEAASLGCRFATSWRAVRAQGRLQAGEWLAVHGCGGVGLSAVAIGAAIGARVVAIDIAPAALTAAREAGAEAVIDASGRTPRQVADAVREITGGGAHVALDALGAGPVLEGAIGSLRRGGRHVQVGLLLGDVAVSPIPMARLIAEELEILGSHGMPARDYPEMLSWLAGGGFDIARLVGRVITLDEAPAALMAMSMPAAGAGMTVVDLDA